MTVSGACAPAPRASRASARALCGQVGPVKRLAHAHGDLANRRSEEAHGSHRACGAAPVSVRRGQGSGAPVWPGGGSAEGEDGARSKWRAVARGARHVAGARRCAGGENECQGPWQMSGDPHEHTVLLGARAARGLRTEAKHGEVGGGASERGHGQRGQDAEQVA